MKDAHLFSNSFSGSQRPGMKLKIFIVFVGLVDVERVDGLSGKTSTSNDCHGSMEHEDKEMIRKMTEKEESCALGKYGKEIFLSM